MKELIIKYLEEKVNGVEKGSLAGTMETPPEKELGDLALPCFGMAKILRKNPRLIAEEIKEMMEAQKDKLGLCKVEAVNGYLNMYFERSRVVKQIIEKLGQDNLGVEKPGIGKTICMDYSSPNIAKNFHVGHLRTTIIGNSLYKLHEKLGYHVIRINHLGDWGTQFGKLIVAYKKYSSKALVEEKGIEELLRIYVKFNEEVMKQGEAIKCLGMHGEQAKQDGKTNNRSELSEEAREWFVKMEQNDTEALEIWNWFKEISLVEYERIYKLLNVEFDSYTGESFYREHVPALVQALMEKGLLTESQGAQVIDLSAYDMPPCMILKQDGGSIYHSRDMAAAIYRKEQYDFEKCLYVTGLEQTLHFKQVFQALKLMGYHWAEDLIHISYGLVSLAGQKLSTRTGNIIYAEALLKEACERALASIEEKNPTLINKENVARQVGVGAVIFHDLFNQRTKNIEFQWEDVLSFEGTTGPYVQYTCARAKSILRKCSISLTDIGRYEDYVYDYLTDDTSYELVKILGEYEAAIKEAVLRYEPSVIARYVMRVATAFNKFYHDCPIMKAEGEYKEARILLVDAVQRILTDACGLLGMKCPDEM